MTRPSDTDTVRAAHAAYRAQDGAAARRLLADDFVFTSPQDDHLDKATYLERCFPTAERFVSQEILVLVDSGPHGVLMVYEYELHDGARYRNTELITVRDGQLAETQVFFGGRVSPSPVETARPTAIVEVGTVFIPVADQGRALAFYVDTLGFEKRVDFPYGGGSRWIEVAPPGAANTLALVPPSEGRSAGGDETRCALATGDIEADHAALLAAGADADAAIAGTGTTRTGLTSTAAVIEDPVPAQLFFRDPDGNRFLLVQPD